MRVSTSSLLATTALISSVYATDCSSQPIEDLTSNFPCINELDLYSCLFSITDGEESTQQSALQSCLESIGCSSDAAAAASQWIFQQPKDCAGDKEGVLSELRKRDLASPVDIVTTDTPMIITPTAAVVAQTITQTFATITSIPFAEYKQMELRDDTATTSTPLVCLTTTEAPFSWCVTSTAAGNNVATTCQTTTTAIVSCVSGLICATQASGDTTCMVRQSYLTLSGLIVTIVFGVFIAAGLGAMLIMCISARRKNQAANRHKFESPTMAGIPSEDALPLISGAQPHAGPSSNRTVSENPFSEGGAYGSGGIRSSSATPAHRVPSSNYGDMTDARRGTPPQLPRLHAGLMSAPDEEEDVGSRIGAR